MTESPWYRVQNCADVVSPALLVYPERVEQNIASMLRIAGRPERLRPHVKTHKMSELVKMQQGHGISRFKCATTAELVMAVEAGATDVLLALQPVGPVIASIVELCARYARTTISVLADDAGVLRELSRAFERAARPLEVLIDVDCGMHRTGVPRGPEATALYELVSSLPGLEPAGLHAYDGHIHETDPALRGEQCERAYEPVAALRAELEARALRVPRLVVGGTPTFPIHARRERVELSPGTSLLWDHGYGTQFPDLPFVPAALLLTRVVSRPGPRRLCLDLGHKAVGSESPPPRLALLGVPDARFVAHSEEHLVVETERAPDLRVGSALYGVPWHICPSVALHDHAVVVKNGRAETVWKITARGRGERLLPAT